MCKCIWHWQNSFLEVSLDFVDEVVENLSMIEEQTLMKTTKNQQFFELQHYNNNTGLRENGKKSHCFTE